MNPPYSKDRRKRQGIDSDPGTLAKLLTHIKSRIARFNALIKLIELTVME